MATLALFRLSTIRARLAAGFGASIGLLLVAGTLAWVGLQRTNMQSEHTVAALSAKTELAERVITGILREVVGGLRYLQVRTPEEGERFLALSGEADRTLRAASGDTILGDRERMVLERVAQLQSALEVRIATTHAMQSIGRTEDAARVLDETSQDISRIEAQLHELRDAVRLGTAQAVDEMESTQRQSELSLAVVIILAFAVAAFFGLSTSRAVSRPLTALQQEMAAIGAGDLRVPEQPLNPNLIAAEYADLLGAMSQARERLRSLLQEVQTEADQVTLAASELTSSA